MARRKVIIDTDPGVDDILALLLALASPELEVLAITTVHGNIDLFQTTRNTISLFNVLHASSTVWAKNYFEEGGQIVLAAGARMPIVPEKQIDAAYFHGNDGLGGVSKVYPQYLPPAGWHRAFSSLRQSDEEEPAQIHFHGLLASSLTAHEEMLSILAREEAGTVSIIALGPLTNLALACTTDYETFSKVEEVVVMGGALNVPGNVTPKAEFNFAADPEAAAQVFSYTSNTPSFHVPTSPDSVAKKLPITLVPLDTTSKICLTYPAWEATHNASELRSWCDEFMQTTFEAIDLLHCTPLHTAFVEMHDPACIWYVLSHPDGAPPRKDPGLSEDEKPIDDRWQIRHHADVRIEYVGRWTRGQSVCDDRGRDRIAEALDVRDTNDDEYDGEYISDDRSWLEGSDGNTVNVVLVSPGSDAFADLFMPRVFGLSWNTL